MAQRLSTINQTNELPELFYINVINQIAPFIPVWGRNIGREALHESVINELNLALEEWLRVKGMHPTARRRNLIFTLQLKVRRVVCGRIFSALRRARNIIMDIAATLRTTLAPAST